MADFEFKVEGLPNIGKGSDRVLKSITKEIEKGLLVSAKNVEGSAKDLVRRGPKTGRIYKRGTVSHQASAPGEPPASDTGRLVNSINSYLEKSALSSVIVAGRGLVNYAKHLEFGTSKMEARPYMLPAFEMNRRKIQDRLNKAVSDGIAKASKK